MRQPEQLGPFRILQQLGRGGMGAVYQGIHTTTGEPVAVKVLLDHLDEESSEARLRFEAEIEALRMLRHPSIVRLNGFGQEDELLYYVMELVCGTTLYKELRKKRGFLWQDVAKIGYEVCLALKHGHDRGITHRDLKPANIMLDNSGVVKIADYGIAHCFGNNRLTGSHAVIGTIEFMSPEQAVAGPVGPKSDLYSLGAVLYALLCRRPPFVAKTLPEIIKKHQSEHIEDVARFRHDAPGELIQIIRHMLERKPENRPSNAYVVAKKLEELLDAEFGSSDAVIVLPSKFDDPVSPPAIDETRTAFLDRNVVKEKTPSQGKDGGDSKTFLLQHDFSHEEKDSPEHAAQLGDKNDQADEHGDANADGEKGDSSQLNDSFGENTSAKSLSVYYDLTGINPAPSGFSNDLTRQTSAFDHLKNKDQTGASQESHVLSRPTDTEGAHDNTSVSGRFPTLYTPRSDTVRHGSHFTSIEDDELDYHFGSGQFDGRPLISVQVVVLSICLIMLGVWAWWMLQPPSADRLYDAIARQIDLDRMRPSSAELSRAESDITKFLTLYPQDDRMFVIFRLQKEIELLQLEKTLDRKLNTRSLDENLLPAQRAYLEAMAVVNTHPEETTQRLEALITLYETPRLPFDGETEPAPDAGKPSAAENKTMPFPPTGYSPEPDLSNPVAITVEIARRRLADLKSTVTPVVESQAYQLSLTIERIKLIEKFDPAKAAEMRKAVVKLYGDKIWAAKLVESLDESRPANDVDVKENVL